MMIIVTLAVCLAAINIVTFLAFRIDKMRAEEGQWRIPETKLLTLALCGGWFGAKLAQRRYRHKTRKQPFCRMLGLVPVVWIGAVAVLGTLSASPHLPNMVASAFSMSEQTNEARRVTPKFFTSVKN